MRMTEKVLVVDNNVYDLDRCEDGTNTWWEVFTHDGSACVYDFAIKEGKPNNEALNKLVREGNR